MNKFITAFSMMSALASMSLAQDVYPGWEEYTTYEYLYSSQHDLNRKGLSETEFMNGLVRDARNELARQFEVGVKNSARLDKEAINGKTVTSFSSMTEFATDVTLKLCEVRTHYTTDGEGYAIAYINKPAARDYYIGEFEQAIGKIDNAIANAGNLIAVGSKIKARDEELAPALRQFDRAGDALAWLGFFDIPESRLQSLMEKCYSREQEVKKLLSGLEHSTAIYLQCDADVFSDVSYPLAAEIRGRLNSLGCRYVSEQGQADWIVNVSDQAGEISETPFTSYTGQSKSMYSVSIFVNIWIKNALTGDMIYNDVIGSAKKVDSDKNRAASQAYAEVVTKVENVLKNVLTR